jgi:quercetin dioxygenase-like cupin family protein
MMNIKDLHTAEKPVSAVQLFKGEGISISIQILEGEQLKEHITKVPAILICITGNVLYGDESGQEIALSPGDYVEIEPMVKHWVDGKNTAQLILMK